jgi:hypothetical protein
MRFLLEPPRYDDVCVKRPGSAGRATPLLGKEMSAERKPRNLAPTASTEREARRLGWFAGAPVTWREYLEQYPCGADEIERVRKEMSHAA